MMKRFENFTQGEQIILELALNELYDYFWGMIERFPKCPDCEYWRDRLRYIIKLQNEILDGWADKIRSA